MLTLNKNDLVTNVQREQMEIRQIEIDWYVGNYSTISGQAAMLAGFSIGQLMTSMPEDYSPPFWAEFSYMFLNCSAAGLSLSAIILSTFLSVWAPSLALRGKNGAADLHRAVSCLRDYQFFIFTEFIVAWILFYISSVIMIWIYYRKYIARMVTLPLGLFVVASIYYFVTITYGLWVGEDDVVEGKLNLFQNYEIIADLDEGLHTHVAESRSPDPMVSKQVCPTHDNETLTFLHNDSR